MTKNYLAGLKQGSVFKTMRSFSENGPSPFPVLFSDLSLTEIKKVFLTSNLKPMTNLKLRNGSGGGRARIDGSP